MTMLICVLLFGAAYAASAQTTTEAPEAVGDAVATPSVEMVKPIPSAENPSGLDMRVSINVPQMDLAQAVRLLADEAGVNVAIGQDVRGVATCRLSDVTVRNALKSLLSANGYGMIEQDNVLVVVSLERQADLEAPLVQYEVIRKTFRIPYTGLEKDLVASSGGIAGAATGTSSAASGGSGGKSGVKPVEETLREMLSPAGKMAYYDRQHLVIVQDIEPVIEVIGEFVAALWDVPTQVYIDSKLIEVTLEKGEALGMNWNVWHKVGDSGETALDPVSGVDYTGTSLRSTALSNQGLPNTTPFSFGVVNANINVFLEAIKTRDRVDLHSNPRILVMNHRQATIIVGQEIPYLSSTQTTAAEPVNTYEFKEVAVRLEVTPHVSEDGIIFMDVHPQVKGLIGYQGDPPQPVLSTREAVTYVAVPDNQTLIIGGLVQRNISKDRWAVPFISRIPLLGLLFRQKADTDTKNDLVFLLNPRIVTAELIQQTMDDRSAMVKDLPAHDGETKR